MFGGIWNAFTGQTDFRARAPTINTKAGTAAINQQAQMAANRAQSGAYSMLASSRAGGPLAAREAQRRAIQAQQMGTEQAVMAQKNLEQNAMQANAANQMQAQGINAQIASQNAQGLQRGIGIAAGAIGGGMMMSDERSKMPFATDRYQSALAADGDDGRRVQWVNSGPDERDTVARHAQESGVDLSPGDYRAMGYAPPGQPQAAAAPTGTQRFGAFLSHLSDQKAKVLADENQTLRAALSSMTGALQPEPRPVTMRKHATWTGREMANRALADDRIPYDVSSTEVSPGGGRITSRTQSMPLSEAEMRRLEARALAQKAAAPTIPSDEDTKEDMGGMHRMMFPEGIEPTAFKYKDGYGDGGESPHVGVLAQDVEKSPEGATVVKEGPDGMKMLDIGGLTSLNTAKLSELEKRLRKLEGAG